MPDVLLRSEESDGVVVARRQHRPGALAAARSSTARLRRGVLRPRGRADFQVEDELITKRAGELAFAPRGVAHTLANQSDGPARYLLVCTPAGFERYFARMNEDPPEWALQEIPFEVERVGPQIGQS